MTDDETAKLAFLRWVASSSKKPWLPRRPEALRFWSAVEHWVEDDHKRHLSG